MNAARTPARKGNPRRIRARTRTRRRAVGPGGGPGMSSNWSIMKRSELQFVWTVAPGAFDPLVGQAHPSIRPAPEKTLNARRVDLSVRDEADHDPCPGGSC